MKKRYFLTLLALLTLLPMQAQTQVRGWQLVPYPDSTFRYAMDTLNNAPSSNQLGRWLRYRPSNPFARIHRGYQLMDRANEKFLERQRDTVQPIRLIRFDRNKFHLTDLVFGRNMEFGNGWRLVLPGVGDVVPELNPDDLFWVGYKVALSYRIAPGVRLSYRPDVYYTLRSKQVYTHHYLYLHYAPRSAGLLVLGGGVASDDLNMVTAQNIYLGEHATGLLGNNPVRSFRKEFLIARNELFVGPLQLTLSGAYERRTAYPKMENHAMLDHQSLAAEAELLFHTTPDYLYATAGGTKYVNPVGYSGPVLGVVYRQAFRPKQAKADERWSEYQRIELLMKGAIKWSKNEYLTYQLTAGKFLNSKYVGIPDERYFDKIYPIGFYPMENAFVTVPRLYTGGSKWGTLQLTYHPNRLLIPNRKHTLFLPDEALHLNVISRFDGVAPFVEGGYSVGLGRDFVRLGAFLGYDAEHKDWRPGMRLSIPLVQLSRLWTERE